MHECVASGPRFLATSSLSSTERPHVCDPFLVESSAARKLHFIASRAEAVAP